MNDKLYIATNNQIAMRAKAQLLEDEMRKLPQIKLQVRHYFSQGVYARELFIPKGVTLTGHIHKYENLNIMSMGEMLVSVGEEVKHIKAPFTIVSPPGTKRVAHALEDTLWTTIHGTYEIDLEKIEHHFIAHTEQEFLEFIKTNEQFKLPLEEQKCLTLTA